MKFTPICSIFMLVEFNLCANSRQQTSVTDVILAAYLSAWLDIFFFLSNTGKLSRSADEIGFIYDWLIL